MKKLGVIFVVILCISAIVFGKIYYHHKVKLAMAEAKTTISPDSTPATDSTKNANTTKPIKISDLTSNMPKELKNMVITAKEKNKILVIDMIGGSEITSLGPLFQTDLNNAYGPDLFNVKETVIKDKTSLDVYHDGIKQTIGNITPDIIIYTPLVMNDDQKVSTDDTTSVIGLLEQKIQIAYPKAYYMVQAPNKTSDQPAINDRIDQIANYMKQQQGVPYLNYLKNWPDGSQMGDVVKSDGHTPNTAGLKIWSTYLDNYFTGK